MNHKKILSLILAGVMMLSLSSVFVFAVSSGSDTCYVQNAIAGLTVAPTLDGSVTEAEWGVPILVTSPAHATKTWANGYVPGASGAASEDQRAKVYMTNDGEYLYVAATLDHTSEDTYGTVSSNATHRAMFAMTVSKQENGTVVQKDNKDYYCLFRVYGKSSVGILNRTYLGSANQANDAPYFKHITKFANGTYTYEMQIKWTDIPGFENGFDGKSQVAFTMRIADTAATASTASRYYSIGGDAASTFSASNNSHSDGVLALTPGEWCQTSNRVAVMPDDVLTMDGNVSEDEWGKPIIITSPDHAAATWTNGYKAGKNATKDSDQRVRVYTTNDGEYLYVAATLDHAVANTNSAAKSGYLPLLAVSVSQYADGTNALSNGGVDQFRFLRVYLNHDGTPGVLSRTYSGATNKGDVAEIKGTTYNAKYDKETQTYSFEMKIAWSSVPGMNTGILNAAPIAMTIRVGDANLGTTDAHENSYYQIGGTAAGSLGQPTPHAAGVLKLNINSVSAEETYVSDVASAGQNIIIDGQIDQNEWGSAVAVMGPQSKDFFDQDKAHGAADQRAKVYLSNDDKYIYVAATLDHADAGVPFTGSDAWKYPLFWFTLSAWDDDTTVKRVDGAEQYTSYRFNYAVTPSCKTLSTNIAGSLDLKTEDYKVIYDAATRTYTYEARIPYSATNINCGKSLDVAFSAQVGTALYPGVAENDRYNLGMAVANYPSQTNRHEGEGRAVKITLNKPSWLTEGNYVKDTVAQKQGDIVIDANVSTQEWGEPVIVTDPAYAKGYWNPQGYWDSEKTMVNADQQAKVYMTNDAEYLYVAATLDHSGANVNLDAANYGQPSITVTLSKYDSKNNVVQVNGKEQFSSYRIGWTKGGVLQATTAAYQLSTFNLSETDWAVKYDEAAQTYIYELRIPLSTTNISIHETSQIAATIQIGDSNYGTNGSENNRYNIGGTGAANKHLATSSNPHANQPVLVMNLRQEYYAKDTASKVPATMNVDGKITVDEWGDPVIVANPSYMQNIGAYRENDAAAKDDSQTARIWISNDAEYIYVGATLDKSANASGDVLTDSNRPHFGIDFSQYDADNTFKLSNGQEQYTGFIVWLDGEGKKHISVRTQELETKELSDSDYAITYDAKTMTYTYEMRIPYSMTNVDWKNDREIAFSATLGAMPNRYLFSLGCEGVHRNHALRLTLNVPPYVTDTVAPFSGAITLDGNVSTSEWGNPIIVTTPDHCKATWNGYWKNDPSYVKPNQTVKIYSTNDDQYVYFAATIDESDLCDMDGAMWEKAHLFISIGRYDEKTDMERILSNQKTYERYVMYRLGFEGATPKVSATGIKVDRVSIGVDDWAIRYDAEARTYTYEIRIPFTVTTLRYGNDNKMNVSIAIADNRNSATTTANVYNIGGTGASYGNANANNFAHTGQSMQIKLNSNPYTLPDNWTPTTEINPVTADLPVWPIVSLSVVSGCVGLYLMSKRKKVKE